MTLPLIDDNTTIEAVFVRLRDMKRGGFVLDDPKGSPVVTTSALGLTQRAGHFAGRSDRLRRRKPATKGEAYA